MECSKPNCKKNNASIISARYDKKIKAIKRQRKCECGHLFTTYEIEKEEIKKTTSRILKNLTTTSTTRKQTPREEWIDFKIFYYGYFRFGVLTEAVKWAEKKFVDKGLKEDGTFLGAMKGKNRKSYFQIFNNQQKIFKEIKIERVKQTVEKCVHTSFYWDKKKFYNKKLHIPDERSKRLINDEIIELNRSVTSYVRKPKYNLEFYRNYKHFDELISHIATFDKSSKLKINLKDRSLLEKFKSYYFKEWCWQWFKEIR